MKKINFLFGALAALAMGGAVTACSDDDLDKGIDNGKVEYDQTRYLSVTVCSPKEGSGSRADNEEIPADNPQFNTGTTDENYIHELYFVFYDANKDYLDNHHISFTNNNATDNGSGGTIGGSDNPSINKVWTSTIPVNLTAGQNMPSYVMAFVNPITPSELVGTSIPEVEKIMRTKVVYEHTGEGEKDHYPMSNSVYYGNNPITGETNVRMIATPITTTQLAKEPTEAAKNPAVEIYVERYAAKINLTMAAGAIAANANQMDEANTPAVNDYTLKFVPEYWRPNGIDKKMYVLKHYAISDGGVTDPDPTITELNTRLKWDWNAPTNFRSYWSCSPSYYSATYPKVSDDIQDGNTYTLHYFSYKEIVDPSTVPDADFRPSIALNDDGSFSGAFYSRETTASSSYWQDPKGYNPVAVVAGAVIVGRYELTNNKTGVKLDKETTFWLYGKTNGKWNLYDTEAGILEAMVGQQNIVLDADNNPVREINDFVVEHPAKSVRTTADAVVAGRFVALQLNVTRDAAGKATNVPTGYKYYDATKEGNDKYVAITTENVDKVNADLLTAGYARQYGKGLCYFNIPIQHLGFTTEDYQKPIDAADGSTEKVFSWKTARAGSFGLVRNHVYTINIKSISGLATALRDENQPIVPPMDEQTYYISAKLNVLNWRIVPTQNVIL